MRLDALMFDMLICWYVDMRRSLLKLWDAVKCGLAAALALIINNLIQDKMPAI